MGKKIQFALQLIRDAVWFIGHVLWAAGWILAYATGLNRVANWYRARRVGRYQNVARRVTGSATMASRRV